MWTPTWPVARHFSRQEIHKPWLCPKWVGICTRGLYGQTHMLTVNLPKLLQNEERASKWLPTSALNLLTIQAEWWPAGPVSGGLRGGPLTYLVSALLHLLDSSYFHLSVAAMSLWINFCDGLQSRLQAHVSNGDLSSVWLHVPPMFSMSNWNSDLIWIDGSLEAVDNPEVSTCSGGQRRAFITGQLQRR